MIARTSKLSHPCGIVLETPLLISSFSSKGFKFKKNQKSEVGDLIKTTAEAITESALVSAFDLHYYLGSEVDLIKRHSLNPDILFIDSGGYETIEDFDMSDVYKYPIVSRPWSADMHNEVLKNIKTVPAVFVSYDNGQDKRLPLKNQIARARKLFDRFPKQMNDFLIKPSKKSEHFLNLNEIIDSISLFNKFDIIGMTEKELGTSISERMSNIKAIRTALDKIGCQSPIHIFGNLDPLISILYFISGAEIFDGLTWLRFAFHDGLTLYKANVDVLAGRLYEKDHLSTKMGLIQNLIYLRSLSQQMKSFVKMHREGKIDEAYQCFDHIGARVKNIILTSK